MMKKLTVMSALALFFSAKMAWAHCPLCAAATGMAVATTRIYGIDDLVVGLFIGSFAVSTALWMNNVTAKKKELIPHQAGTFVLLSLVITLATLYFSGLLDLQYRIFGMDRIFAGTIMGTAVTFASFEAHKKLRMLNGNKNFVLGQGIILPFLSVVILGIAVYLAGWAV